MTSEWAPSTLGLGWWVGVGLVGMAVGIVSGMFGVGGNFILIPALSLGFHVPLPVTVGTSLSQVIGSASSALVRNTRLKQGEPVVSWIMMGGAIMGSAVGAATLSKLAEMRDLPLWGSSVPAAKLVITLTLMLLLLLVAYGMARDARSRPATAPLGPGPLTRLRIPPIIRLRRAERQVSLIVFAYLGLALGFLNGLVGMGGGVILLPLLLYGIGMRIHMAVATGNVLLVGSAVAGTLMHARLGHVHLGMVFVLLMGSTAGVPIGASIAARMDGRRLRALSAATICITILTVAIDFASHVWQ